MLSVSLLERELQSVRTAAQILLPADDLYVRIWIVGELRSLGFHNKTQRGIQDLATMLNPKIRGWINYYGTISRKSLKPVFYYLHHRMIRWILNKYKSLKGSKVKAVAWLRQITRSYPNLFYHWSLGYKLV